MLKTYFTFIWALYSATNCFNNLWKLLEMTQIYGHPKEEIWIKKIVFLWDISPRQLPELRIKCQVKLVSYYNLAI